MIKPEQIPREAVRAAMTEWEEPKATERDIIAAAINAWPGMRVSTLFPPNDLFAVLPLPPEKNDD